MGALNYARMPGFGDLPGDSSHRNSPDFDNEAAELAEEERSDWFHTLPADKRADMLWDFIEGRQIGNTWLCEEFDEFICDSTEWERESRRRSQA